MKGIPYFPPMIPKVLSGEKTQTRRLQGLDKINESPDDWILIGETVDGLWGFGNKRTFQELLIKCPYIPGEVRYLKETWAAGFYWDNYKPSEIAPFAQIWYATEPREDWVGKTRPSIFMPEKFSRKKQRILSAEPQRLWDITEADAIAEGVTLKDTSLLGAHLQWENHRMSFEYLWDSINPKHPWSKNYWVWKVCIELEVK